MIGWIGAACAALPVAIAIAEECFEDLSVLTLYLGTDGPDHMVGTNLNERFCSRGSGDTVEGGDGCDFIDGGPGSDPLLQGNRFDDYIDGGEGNDIINGGQGNDTVDGGPGNDTMHGDAHDDVMLGDLGDDYLENWDGNDTYVYRSGDGNDTIEDTNGMNVLMFVDISAPTQDQRVGLDRLITVPGGSVHIIEYYRLPERWLIQYSIPCTDIRSFTAKCKRGQVKAKVVMRNNAHDGLYLLFGASYLNYRAEIRDGKAVFKNSGECLQMIGEFDVYLASHERCGGYRQHVVCE